jgi:hypothetical protein
LREMFAAAPAAGQSGHDAAQCLEEELHSDS